MRWTAELDDMVGYGEISGGDAHSSETARLKR